MSAAVAEARPISMHSAMQQAAGGVTIELTKINPQCAKAWMDPEHGLNKRNFRAYSELTAGKYADDMVSGEFGAKPTMTPESCIVICVDPETGNTFLGNGQHRLGGCILAAKRSPSFDGFWAVVMRGIDPLAMLKMDVGKKRSLADYLKFLEVPNANVVAPALRIMFTYRNKPDQLATHLGGTADQLLHLLENRGDINRAVKFATAHGTGRNRTIPMTTSWLAVARMLTSEVEGAGTDVDQFWSLMTTREELGKMHPVAQMHRILDTKGTLVKVEYRMPPATMFGHMLKCWNNWRNDKLTNLVFRPGQEAWPILQ